MRRLSLALLSALFQPSAARAEPPPAPPLPTCAESGVEREYQTMAMAPFQAGALRIGPIEDLGVFPPSERDNQYANDEMFVKAVRFCQTVVTLPDGTADPTYWRVTLVFNFKTWAVQQVYCSLKHDVWGNGCKTFRPDAP